MAEVVAFDSTFHLLFGLWVPDPSKNQMIQSWLPIFYNVMIIS